MKSIPGLILVVSLCLSQACSNPFARNDCELNEAEPAEALCAVITILFTTEPEFDTPSEIQNRNAAIAFACSAAIAAREKCDSK